MAEFEPEQTSAERSFVDRWLAMPEVHALLACAQRLRIRIGLRGGVVRNFVLGNRSKQREGASLLDLVDPFSDIDCVLDNASDWNSVAGSIASTFPFAGYHRWEMESLESINSRLHSYRTLPSERLVVWHHGFAKGQPRITLQGLGIPVDSIVAGNEFFGTIDSDRPAEGRVDPWVTVLDALRFARYALQYPTNRYLAERLFMPERSTLELLIGSQVPPRTLHANIRRLNLAILDIVATAETLSIKGSYLQDLWSRFPEQLRKSASILSNLSDKSVFNAAYVGALVYRQPNAALRTRLLTEQSGENLRFGLKSLIPWTPLWSIQSVEDSCCRHSDFQNGVAVLSWRPTNPIVVIEENVPYSYAAVAQVHRPERYRETSEEQPIVLPVPGLIRTGPSVTLRLDHAFPSAYFGRNVKVWIGLMDAREG